MKIIIFGSNGMLGGYIYKYFSNLNKFKIIEINRSSFDLEIDKFQKLIDIFNKYNVNQNDIIINCIGLLPHRFNSNSLLNQRFSDDIYKKFILVNSIFPHHLEKLYFIFNCKIIHITSDCVFLGNKGQYNENDIPDLYNVYGITKTCGESDQICNIRTSIIGKEINNKKSLLEWILSQKNKTINGYTNYLWNGLTCLELAKIIHKIISTNSFWKGTRHIYSPDTVSKYDIACLVNQFFDLNININEFSLDTKIDRTLSSIFNNSLDLNVQSIKNQIMELKSFEL